MKLTEDQLAEIRVYIFHKPRFRETYNELYDHILNSLEDMEGEFNMSMVTNIVNNDFGGFDKIQAHEELYQKEVTRKYKRLLWKEMLNTFKFPDILGNFILLGLTIILYSASLNLDISTKSMYQALIIVAIVPMSLYLIKRFIVDRKHSKLSIKYDVMHHMWLLGFFFSQLILALVNFQSYIHLSLHGSFIIASVFFFISSVYIRAYNKLYNTKINVLAV